MIDSNQFLVIHFKIFFLKAVSLSQLKIKKDRKMQYSALNTHNRHLAPIIVQPLTMASSENKLFRKNTWKNIIFLPHFLTLRIWQEHTERAISEGGRQGRKQLMSKIMQLSSCEGAVHSGTEEAQERVKYQN